MTVKVRISPSPTGTPHVGLIRTALFNWAYARHTSGTFVFRIEDTDAARDTDDSYHQLLDAMRWLGLDWDEGPDVGGPHAPYRQSQRGHIYTAVVDRLTAAGYAYRCSCANGCGGACTAAAGAVRFRMPATTISFDDLIRGTVTVPADQHSDFVLVRSDGAPVYQLTNPVDDAIMGITHILRGEDLLPSTARQIALHQALVQLGYSAGVPVYAHLPYVTGDDNRKLAKRDPRSSLWQYRDAGYTPAGLLNYLAGLGWSAPDGNDVFDLDTFVRDFDVADVKSAPARFDADKARATNAAHIRGLDLATYTAAGAQWLTSHTTAGFDPSVWAAVASHAQPRTAVWSDIGPLVNWLFTTPDLDDNARAAVAAHHDLLAGIRDLIAVCDWDNPDQLVDDVRALGARHNVKLGVAQAPLRAAVTGTTAGLPVFHTMVALDRATILDRIDTALARPA